MTARFAFRIRPPVRDIESIPVDEWLAKKNQYAEFLSSRRSSIPPDLWRFFRDDFFHDGSFEAFGWDRLPSGFLVRLNCPNIERIHSDDRRTYVTTPFECEFYGVHQMTIRTYECESVCDLKDLTFVGAEIEAEQELIAAATSETGDQHHSILIDCEKCSVAMIFGGIQVRPVEPLAFAALLDDERFVIPLAQ